MVQEAESGGQMTCFKKKKIQVLVKQVGWIKDKPVNNWHELLDEKELQVRA